MYVFRRNMKWFKELFMTISKPLQRISTATNKTSYLQQITSFNHIHIEMVVHIFHFLHPF